MSNKVKEWVGQRTKTINGVLEMADLDGEFNEALATIITDCIKDLNMDGQPAKLEWSLMAYGRPHGIHDHVDCYIILNCNKNDVLERPWNTRHNWFDDSEYDDFEYGPSDVYCWMIKPSLDLPPAP